MSEKRYALVTGSSRGIGKAIATELAKEGFVVAVHGSRDSDQLKASLEAVACVNEESICLAADLADPAAIDGMFGEVSRAFGNLDVLVNNAAVQNPSPILDLSVEDWDRLMAVNLRAAVLCGQHAGRMMKKRGGGRIVSISSVHGTAPRRYCAHFSTP